MREYESYYNDQSMHQKLSAFHTKSTNHRITASTKLSYIESAKLESWKGTEEAFIFHWKDRIRLYETLVPTDSHFSEHYKNTMIGNSVASVFPLRSVKDQSDQYFSHSGKELTC